MPRARKIRVIRCAVSTNAAACARLDAARPRQIDVDDLHDPPRPRRHHHHAVGEEHRLVDAVGDEQHGLPRAQPQRLSSMRICSRVSASSAPNGSSISSSGGSWISARQIATRWRMPPDSSHGQLVVEAAKPDRLSSAARARVGCGVAGRASPPAPARWPARCASRAAPGFWNTMPMIGHRPRHRVAVESAPRPRWRSSPATIRSSVLLPQPDGPTMATNSPRDTRSIESSAIVVTAPR